MLSFFIVSDAMYRSFVYHQCRRFALWHLSSKSSHSSGKPYHEPTLYAVQNPNVQHTETCQPKRPQRSRASLPLMPFLNNHQPTGYAMQPPPSQTIIPRSQPIQPNAATSKLVPLSTSAAPYRLGSVFAPMLEYWKTMPLSRAA